MARADELASPTGAEAAGERRGVVLGERSCQALSTAVDSASAAATKKARW